MVSFNISPPFNEYILYATYFAASLSTTQGPPNGQPVPVAMSIPKFNRFASLNVYSNISIHFGDRKSMNLLSAPFIPYIGVISKPPNPACLYNCINADKFCLSTALPCHHQRVHGLVC